MFKSNDVNVIAGMAALLNSEWFKIAGMAALLNSEWFKNLTSPVFNQREVKLKLITPFLCEFLYTVGKLLVISRNSNVIGSSGCLLLL